MDTIESIELVRRNVVGKVSTPKEAYDLITIMFIRLGEAGEQSEDKLIRLLSVLLSTTIAAEKKKQILQEDYQIPMTEKMEKEVSEMAHVMDEWEAEKFENGRQQGIKQSITHVVTICQDIGLDDQQIVEKLITNFDLSYDEAKTYIVASE